MATSLTVYIVRPPRKNLFKSYSKSLDLEGDLFIPFLTGSKTPASRFERNKEGKWEITARKDLTKDRMFKDHAKHKDMAFYA
ncbi:hypothetical protein E6W99_21060 [Metabacillus sediminilitoris]|uniref:Uncharacterized protein n=1 Tax=Metabacillus sediminilitoris TaxID=2567941 RepID=A0A4S4BP16_9BACI|nr:hypothetical protein E6W99_21060 [Metabacillus sediminilitoris]